MSVVEAVWESEEDKVVKDLAEDVDSEDKKE